MFYKRFPIALVFFSIMLISTGFAYCQAVNNTAIKTDSLAFQPISVINLPQNDTNYVSVIKPPLSRKIRSGFVTLASGVSGEEHSTESYEELLVILDGKAVLHSGEIDKEVTVGQVAYVPPHTKHFMKNGGTTTLKYLYIVTKTE
jgi:quercetin dioxygenase-like cupin family protein